MSEKKGTNKKIVLTVILAGGLALLSFTAAFFMKWT